MVQPAVSPETRDRDQAAAARANGDAPGLLRVALLGNPNTGKTTLFNRLSGLRHKTSNFPGTTLEARVGRVGAGGAVLRPPADCSGGEGTAAINQAARKATTQLHTSRRRARWMSLSSGPTVAMPPAAAALEVPTAGVPT